ncbi:metal-dependent hydrolase [Pacificoceanicola onchidii]|uniref:metal-dependent hydrolase n=1 Tax=Pacificoceanicola onchidii TaxID=2562685 RepID=UPI0010A45591|nr:metal-dependent hydrolase [Pacificoceanicola onchidii]
MNIIWLGHGSFRIETGDQVLLIDPWINGNPMMEGQDTAAAIAGATQILVTHGHFDHTQDIVEVSDRTGAPVSSIYELAQYLFSKGAKEGHAFNKGGQVRFGDVTVDMVPASHSSSIVEDGRGVYMGAEIGYVIRGNGKTLYFSGDTTVMADMGWIGDYYKPDIGILSAGGYYTMDMKLAAYAAKTYFNFKTVIPCHYRTFPALEQSAEKLASGLPGLDVIEPQVMEPIRL